MIIDINSRLQEKKNEQSPFRNMFVSTACARRPALRRYARKLAAGNVHTFNDVVAHGENEFFGHFPAQQTTKQKFKTMLNELYLNFTE
jgi:hypothetical protein